MRWGKGAPTPWSWFHDGFKHISSLKSVCLPVTHSPDFVYRNRNFLSKEKRWRIVLNQPMLPLQPVSPCVVCRDSTEHRAVLSYSKPSGRDVIPTAMLKSCAGAAWWRVILQRSLNFCQYVWLGLDYFNSLRWGQWQRLSELYSKLCSLTQNWNINIDGLVIHNIHIDILIYFLCKIMPYFCFTFSHLA